MRAVPRVGAILLGLALAAGAAEAQSPGGKPAQGSPLPGGGTTRDLTQPGNGGVAGTGLGGSTVGGGAAPGTGGSVRGPAGQGIDGQGVSTGIGTGTSGTSGTGATARP